MLSPISINHLAVINAQEVSFFLHKTNIYLNHTELESQSLSAGVRFQGSFSHLVEIFWRDEMTKPEKYLLALIGLKFVFQNELEERNYSAF